MSFAWGCAVDSLLQDEMEKYLEKELSWAEQSRAEQAALCTYPSAQSS